MYVASATTNSVIRYPSTGNLFVSNGLPVGTNGNANYGVLKSDAAAGNFITTYAAKGTGGLDVPRHRI